ncbi:hypothetical protein FB45DRAFT_843461 [Roridomyces roridus]|uniref:MADS-box domain-containing protein n=1 Tax=Roridomyces roridus TaxID=1738132 RepID=A0AAD7B740_9AGAR|nr:hypothetical protein FB45DRAFT_843461 [Roridomyces roridus]
MSKRTHFDVNGGEGAEALTFQQDSAGEEDFEDEVAPKSRGGRRKIKIEYIQDKGKRHITFSKRKAGIMKKAYEISTLTGTQILLVVVSETGLVYTFTTAKLQPMVTQAEGKNLIQRCLNAAAPPLVPESDAEDGEPASRSARDDSTTPTNSTRVAPPAIAPAPAAMPSDPPQYGYGAPQYPSHLAHPTSYATAHPPANGGERHGQW